MADENHKLMHLSFLCNDFRRATCDRMEQDDSLREKAAAAVTAEEMEEREELVQEILEACPPITHTDLDKYHKGSIKLADIDEAHVERVLSKDELVDCLPPGLQNNPEYVALLKEYGANNLAALCEYTLSL